MNALCLADVADELIGVGQWLGALMLLEKCLDEPEAEEDEGLHEWFAGKIDVLETLLRGTSPARVVPVGNNPPLSLVPA